MHMLRLQVVPRTVAPSVVGQLPCLTRHYNVKPATYMGRKCSAPELCKNPTL